MEENPRVRTTTLDFGVVRASISASETPRPRPTARQNGRRPRMLTRSVIGRGEDGVAVPVWCVRARQVCVRERARGVRAPRWAQREARAEGAGGPDPSAFGLLRRRCFTAPWAVPRVGRDRTARGAHGEPERDGPTVNGHSERTIDSER